MSDDYTGYVDCDEKCEIPEGYRLVEVPRPRHAWTDVARCPNEGCERAFLIEREADSEPPAEPACEEWVAVVSLPRDRYRVRETADGWEVLTKDDHGAFS